MLTCPICVSRHRQDMELRYKTGGVKCPAFPFHYVQSHYKLGSSISRIVPSYPGIFIYLITSLFSHL